MADNNNEILGTLKSWAEQGKLSEATLSENGLSLGDTLLENKILKVDLNDDKTMEYSLASIYLFIVDPNRGLVAYRNACKQHNVTDMVKAVDKPALVEYFIGAAAAAVEQQQTEQTSATETATATATATASQSQTEEPVDAEQTQQAAVELAQPIEGSLVDQQQQQQQQPHSKEKPAESADSTARQKEHRQHHQHKHHKSSSKSHRDRERSDRGDQQQQQQQHKDKRRDRERSKDRHHHHKDKARRREEGDKDENKSPKKKPKEVTEEELFSNLNEVVGKRTTELDVSRIEITKALSADGFEVAPEILETFKESAKLIFENEIPVGDSASILRAANPRKDLNRVLQIFNETVHPPKPPGAAGSSSINNNNNIHHKYGKPPPPPPSGKKPTIGSSGVNGVGNLQRPYLVGKRPVIIVPKSMSAPLTMINAHEFLSKGKFLPREAAMKQGLNPRTAPSSFTRTVNVSTASGTVEYEIVDNPKKLGPDIKNWERIVAVIALGQAWQFKDWLPEYSNPVQLFSRTFGFYVSMDGDRVPAEVNSWSVKQGTFSRDKRGLDSVTSALFWNGLDNWMTVNRRELLPQPRDG